MSETSADSRPPENYLVAVIHAVNHSDKVRDAAYRRYKEMIGVGSHETHALAAALDVAIFVARTEGIVDAPSAWEWADSVIGEHGEEAMPAGTKEQIERLTEVCPTCEGDNSGGGVDEPTAECPNPDCVGGRVPKARSV